MERKLNSDVDVVDNLANHDNSRLFLW